jgi:ElaB/YqjD/DUF883 family membrane-anchored ribosome-binding protein
VANTGTRTGSFASGAQDAEDGLFDVADQVGQKAADIGQQAIHAVDAQRKRAASGLDAAAQKLRVSADRLPGGEDVSRFAHDTADALGATADYFRTHDLGDMLDDVGGYVKTHPTQALVGATALGFLAGWLLRRR